MRGTVYYVLTIDFESWVHRDRYLDGAARRALDGGYILSAGMTLLKLLQRYEARATFFVVAEIYDWYPQLVERIATAGHEIAYHTHTHARARRDVLERELALSRRFLDRFAPKGFRAPEMYLPGDSLALVRQSGFTYDSSVYGPGTVESVDGIVELPVASRPFWRSSPIEYPRPLSVRLMLREIPYGSGFFLGLLGGGMEYFLDSERRSPAVLVVHPWQISTPPRQWRSLLRGLPRTLMMLPYYRICERALERLLARYRFSACEQAVSAHSRPSPEPLPASPTPDGGHARPHSGGTERNGPRIRFQGRVTGGSHE